MSDLSPEAKELWERAKKGGFEPNSDQIERVRLAVLERMATAPVPRGGSSVGSLPKWAKVAGFCVAIGAIVATGMKLMPRSGPAPVVGTPEPAPTAAVANPEVAPTAEAPPSTEGQAVTTGRSAPAQERAGKEPGRAAPAARSSSGDLEADTLPEQVRIITEARLALGRRAFAQALAKVNDYEARYPKGVFLEEDLAIRILSLCGLGRDKEAARTLDTLERTVPNSRQLDRVRSSCAGAVKTFSP